MISGVMKVPRKSKKKVEWSDDEEIVVTRKGKGRGKPKVSFDEEEPMPKKTVVIDDDDDEELEELVEEEE